MDKNKIGVLLHPCSINFTTRSRVVVSYPYHWFPPFDSSFVAIFICDCELFLSSKPTLILREEVNIEVIKDDIACFFLEIVQVK